MTKLSTCQQGTSNSDTTAIILYEFFTEYYVLWNIFNHEHNYYGMFNNNYFFFSVNSFLCYAFTTLQ